MAKKSTKKELEMTRLYAIIIMLLIMMSVVMAVIMSSVV